MAEYLTIPKDENPEFHNATPRSLYDELDEDEKKEARLRAVGIPLWRPRPAYTSPERRRIGFNTVAR